MIVIKSDREIALMREAGRIVAVLLSELRERIRPGVTTAELDRLAAQVLAKHDATSPFYNYPNHDRGKRPFPGQICASVNEELVHGVPGKRALKEGDIIKIDCGAVYKGWIADSAWTFAVGKINPAAQRLLEVTEGALYASLKEAKAGNRTGDMAHALQHHVETHGFNVVREYVSHGVGRRLHEDPQMPNFGGPGTGSKLRKGMTIAVEPMVLSGTYKTKVLPDQWTVAAKDGKLTAHFEHTIVITDGEPEILTKLN
ncbi:MAG: type I methionyl aminopeptidase [Chloroflexi bacterium]|nr:type I methionyl aminopeptidase [Chloroflexota bacterium]